METHQNIKKEIKYKYWDGFHNKCIRYFFYQRKGIEIVNEFRYLVFAIMAIYALLKMSNPMMMVFMFIVSVPLLIILGYYASHHVNKRLEYLNIEFATHFGRYQYDLLEKQIKILEEILEETKNTKRNSV